MALQLIKNKQISQKKALKMFDGFISQYYPKENDRTNRLRNAILENKCPVCKSKIFFKPKSEWFPICQRSTNGINFCSGEKNDPVEKDITIIK